MKLWRLTKLSLETRIILSVVTLLGLAIYLVALLSYQLLKSDLKTLQADQQYSAATLMATRIDRLISEQITALGRLSDRLAHDEKLRPCEQLQTVIDGLPLLHLYFNAGLIVMDKNGNAVADSPASGRVGQNYGDRAHIQRVLRDGVAVVSPPVMGKTINAPVMSISVPIRDEHGHILGLVQGVINLSKPNFLDDIGRYSYGKTGGYIIADRASNRVVAATDKRRIMQPTQPPGENPLHDRFMAGYEGSGIGITPFGVEVLASGRQIPVANWFVVAALPVDEAFAPVRRMTRIVLLAAVLLVLAASAAAWWILRRQLAQVRKERDYYSAQMRQSSDGIFVVNPQNRRILEANLQLHELLGYGPQELIGLGLGDVVEVSAEQIEKQMAAIRTQGRVQVGERLFKCKNGALLQVEVSASAVRTGGSEVIMINVRDITTRKEAETALKTSEERYRGLSQTLADRVEYEVKERLEQERMLGAVFRTANVGICVTDRNYRFVRVNKAYCDIYGYSENDLIGRPFTLVVPPEHRAELEKLHDDFLDGKTEISAEWEVVRKDGKRIHILATAARLENVEGGPFKITSVSDISELKRLQRAWTLQQTALIQQSKLAELGSMIGAIAHQWKQPLNTIALLTQNLPDAYEDGELDKPAIDTHVDRVINQVRFMSQTVEDFRNFYKPSRQLEIFELKAAIDSVSALLETQLLKYQIGLEVHLEPELWVEGYSSEFKQVILNLITNARDALEERAVENKRIVIAGKAAQKSAIVTVTDNGGGIAEHLLPDAIFEPFASTKGEKGTGIGLSLGRTIIEEKMHGRLFAHNTGNGAEFTIELPLKGRPA